MTHKERPNSCTHLAKTNCSIEVEDNGRDDNMVTKGKGKKRIGRYSFYFQHLLGKGYGGHVYKGVKDNDRGQWLAIKVINTKDLKTANSQLLKTEIAIMQELDHPNIVRFVDVLYSNNHCYLVMEFCEGGTLEEYQKKEEHIEWGNISHQLAQGCNHMAAKNILHRDLKPANIFLKEGVWKIGDFGFARKISHTGALIIESYKVGSPLYMPLETLQRNMYSIKSDSFSLGVIIYHMLVGEFPYNGKDIIKLIACMKEKQLNLTKYQLIPIQVIQIIKGLCNPDNKTRLGILQTDFEVFRNQKSIGEIEKGLKGLTSKVTDQVVLCHFVNYLMKNSVHFLQDDHIIYNLMSNHLYHLTTVFKWEQSSSLKGLMKDYLIPQGNVTITDSLYRKLLVALETEINILKFRQDSSLYEVALEKCLEYYHLTKCILQSDTKGLIQTLSQLTLHQSFSNLSSNPERVSKLMEILLKE